MSSDDDEGLRFTSTEGLRLPMDPSGSRLDTGPYPEQAISNSPSDETSGQVDFLKDRHGHMTFGRRIALWLSSNYKWYNPHLGEEQENGDDAVEPPSLAKAWAFFDHVTLERYVVQEEEEQQQEPQSKKTEDVSKKERVIKIFHKGDRRLNIAEPGERELKTKLYSPLTTPLGQLGDFGLGYGVYFSTVRSFAILSFFAGLLNIPNLMYFGSDEYSGGQPGVSTLLQGSAICTGNSERKKKARLLTQVLSGAWSGLVLIRTFHCLFDQQTGHGFHVPPAK
jgi:hypothetical protein